MTKMIFVSLPVTDLQTSIAFYKACLLYTSDAADE